MSFVNDFASSQENPLSSHPSPQSSTVNLQYLGTSAHAQLNTPVASLIEQALTHNEGHLASNGALVVKTGTYTGRSPQDRLIVDTPEVHDTIAWGKTNKPLSPKTFEALWDKALNYLSNLSLQGKEIYATDGLAGADRTFAKRFRVIGESAAQSLFIHQLLIRPTADELTTFGSGDYTVLALPNLEFNPDVDGTASHAIVALDFASQRILIAGTKYSGEIKKAVFTAMNYHLPEQGVLPMHCSANCEPLTGASALFFGLSGTGKTTLSASPNRCIIGDDEHGWSQSGIFNFEGGCYAKCIDLTSESEPEIYNAIRFGALVENVVMDPDTCELDFSDSHITDNTRVGYPIEHIPGAVESGVGNVPEVLIFLTADAFGVLPPISRLTPEAAMYHFVTGFTSKVAGTECGISEPVPTFSSMFGEPFMPRPASVYAELLGKRIAQGDTQVYLVNTGWAGGAASEGVDRIPLRYTRTMVHAALSGELDNTPLHHDDIFNLDVPESIAGVPDELLNPSFYWESQGRTREAYLEAANKLAHLFETNFATRHRDMDPTIAAAGPKAIEG